MGRKKEKRITEFQRVYEKTLSLGALLLVAFHSWISFARHLLAPENRIFESGDLQMLMQIDKWLALALLCAGIIYLCITRVKFSHSWIGLKKTMRQMWSKEWGILIALFAWYIICSFVHAGGSGQLIKEYELWIADMAICIFVMFPLGYAARAAKTRKGLEWIMHALMLFSTGFVVWALYHLFRLNIVTLPNGLQLGMTSGYAFYAGVNQNIGAAIGVCMVLICVYMMATQRRMVKIVYAIALMPHLAATLLTNSRGSYLSLQIALPVAAFMAAWNGAGKHPARKRAVVSSAAAVLTAVVFWWLRSAVFDLFEAVTHLGEFLGKTENAVREIDVEAGRIRIWHCSLAAMFSSPRNFFIGIPLGDISYAIQEVMERIYGTNELFAHAHNAILQTGLAMGVPAMIAFVAFLIMLAIRCVRVGIDWKKRNFRGAYVLPVAVLALVIINMFEAFLLFYISITACVFFLFGGWITAIDSEKK